MKSERVFRSKRSVLVLLIGLSFMPVWAQEFITTWQTTTNNESITIPTEGTGYDYTVDWGDGTIEVNQTGDATHTYATAGVHTVRISGDFPRMYFNNTGDKDKIQTIEQWGTIQWASMQGAFRGCSNLVLNATDTPNLTNVSNASSMFDLAMSFIDNGGAMGSWDVRNIITMNSMFAEASSFNGNISGWNVSGVNDMAYMFFEADNFNQDISGWIVSAVSNMSFMFSGAIVFDQNLGSWDISSVTLMEDMLIGTNSFSSENFDHLLTGWATLDAGETQIPTNILFGAPNTTYCNGESAYNLLDTTYNWTINNDAGLSCPFVTVWETTSANESITIPTDGVGYSYNIDWGDGNSDSGETGDATHTYTTAGTYTVKISGDFPRIYFNNQVGSTKIQSIESWGDIQWDSMRRAFYGCSNLVLNATDVPNFTSVTNMARMFDGATNLVDNEDQIGNWNVSSVTEMRRMFTDSSSFNEDLSNWDISIVDNMTLMFSNATSFSQANYDALLIAWSQLNVQPDVNFGAPPAFYCSGQASRTVLTSAPNNWIISGDNGLQTDCTRLEAKVFLSGPYNPVSQSTITMNDDLRVAGVLPTNSPYGDQNTINSDIFNTSGMDAVVDWVFVEFRDKTDIDNVLYSAPALLQRDGDVVSLDGLTPLSIYNITPDDYYISISHRNHISVATVGTIAVNNTGATIDLTNASNVYGTTNALKEVETGVYAMYPGDTDSGGQIQVDDYNTSVSYLGQSGYLSYDLNLDGQVQISELFTFLLPHLGLGIAF